MNQRETRLIMNFLLAVLGWLWVGGGVAFAQQEASLRGKYNLGYTRHCMFPATLNGNVPPLPDLTKGSEGLRLILEGVASFNGNGTGTFSGTQIVPNAGATMGFSGQVLSDGTSDGMDEFIILQHVVSCNVSYTLQLNGKLSLSLSPCTLTVLPGSGSGSPDGGTTWVDLAGATASLTNLHIEGRMSLDGTIIGLTSTTTGESLAALPSFSEVASEVEKFTWLTGPLAGLGPPNKRICKGNGLATSQR